MGVLIHFTDRSGRTVSRLRDGQTAEILLFTGVRYERQVEEPSTPHDGSNRDNSRPRRRRRG